MLISPKLFRFVILACTLPTATTAWSGPTLSCVRTSTPPAINGRANDDAWINTKELTIKDAVADVEHRLTCVFDDKRIYIKANYNDSTESRTHKTGVWNEDAGLYENDVDLEDTLLFKWNMDDNKGDLSISSDTPYNADVWYWKAFRTDRIGFADDKNHIYSNESMRNAKKRISKRGNRFYLARRSDKGVSAYKPLIHIQYAGSDRVSSYSHRLASGSRGDIKAQGRWSNGQWTIEFSRALDTGNADDVRFKTNRRYQFGVSRYEIAGTEPINDSNNPLHGTGDIEQTITLIFTESLAAQE